MPESFEAFGASLLAFLPNLLAAIAILVIGWLIALGASKLVQGLLRRTSIDDRIAGALKGGRPDRVNVEKWIALAVFWLIMLFVIMIFLQTLNLGTISEPINNLLTGVLAFLPKLAAAAALLLLAWVIATVLKLLITRVLSASGISQRLSDNAQVDPRNRITIGQTIGNVVYWLVFLLFLPAILDTLELQGILAPVQGMVNSILGALPNILGAVVVLAIGWLVARIVRQIVANLLAGIGVDRITNRAGVSNVTGTQRLSDILATIVFVLILIPVVIAALNVLNIPAISQPAANMLNQFLAALPNIFGAFVLLAIAFVVARLVGTLISSLLSGMGFDRLFSAQGPIPVTGVATTTTGGQMGAGRTMPSQIVGWIVVAAIVLFAVMEAANLLGFESLTALLGTFIVAAWNILFGLVIFGLGLWLGNVVYKLVYNTGTSSANLLANAARIAVIVFSGALALRQMGIAESIVNLAFGLILGAIAVAAAIAFGLGGRDFAHQVLERTRSRIQVEANKPAAPPPPTTLPPAPGIPRTGGTMGESSTTTGGPSTGEPLQGRDLSDRDLNRGDFPERNTGDYPDTDLPPLDRDIP